MISVIVPARNEEARIGECLHSLTKQTYQGRMEIMVVDDGSTDRTRGVVRRFPHVRLLKQKQKGPAAARNAGAKKARGTILLFTDGDCVPARTWVQEMVAPFKDKRIMGVQGIYKTKQKGLVARFSQLEIEDRYERMRRWETIDFIGTYAAAYRSSVFTKAGGFDESFPIASGEDPDLSFRIAGKGNRLVMNDQAVVFHQHPNSLRDYLKLKFWRAYWRVALYKKHKGKMVRESYTPQFVKVQIGLFGLLVLSLLASLIVSSLLLAAVFVYLLLIASTIPFSSRTFRKDQAVGIASLGILQLRSLVFGMGLIEGYVRGAGT